MIDLDTNPNPWWHKLFGPYDLTAKQDKGVTVSGSLVSAAQNVATMLRVGVPAVLRLGPQDKTNVAGGSGTLITNGEDYGILTAGHVAHAATEAANAGRRIWAAIMQPPNRVEERQTTRRRVTLDVSGRTPGIGLNIIAPGYRIPADNHGRTDLGVMYLPQEAVKEMCEEIHVEPFDVTNHEQVTTPNPLHGLHVAIGTPVQCDGLYRAGQPFVMANSIAPCRTYTSGGFDYIGYGANPENSSTTLDWHGFSGGPVWALQPTADAIKRSQGGEHQFSAEDFSAPQLRAILCYQKVKAANNLDTPEGFRHEIYAHLVDAKVLAVAAEMLARLAASEPTAPRGRIVIDWIKENE